MFNREEEPFQVLLDGGYFSDLVFTGLPEFPRLGHEIYSQEFHVLPGGAYNTAVALQRLGLKTAWPCRFGSDPFSQYVKEHALAEGLDPACFTQTDQPSLQITVAFSIDSERAFLSYSDRCRHAPAGMGAEIAAGLAVRLAPGARRGLSGIVCGCARTGPRVFMDCQAHSHSLADAGIKDILRQVDVFAPNVEEARCLTGQSDCEAALEMLAELVPMVIIKLGRRRLHLPAG